MSSPCPTCGNAPGEAAVLCPDCGGDAHHDALTRDRWNVRALWGDVVGRFRVHWGALSVLVLVLCVVGLVGGAIVFVPAAVLGSLANSLGLGTVPGNVLLLGGVLLLAIASTLAVMGVLRVCVELHLGQKVRAGALLGEFRQWRQVMKLWGLLTPLLAVAAAPTVAGALLGSGLLGFVGSCVQLALAAVASVLLPWVLLSFVRHPALGLFAHLVRTGALLQGQLLGVLGVHLIGMAVVVLGMLACGVGAIPATAFQLLLVARLYLTLENAPAFVLAHPPREAAPPSS